MSKDQFYQLKNLYILYLETSLRPNFKHVTRLC